MENDREDLSFTTLGNAAATNEPTFISVQHQVSSNFSHFKKCKSKMWILFEFVFVGRL